MNSLVFLEVLSTVLSVLLILVDIWMVLSFFYYLIVSFWGFGKVRKYADHAPEARFLVLIPACNEEVVIQDVVRSVQNTRYPRELIDVCVIADNCKDRTHERAEEQGARVFDTYSAPGEPVGKPHAIKKVLELHPEFYEQYDMLVIIDADNVVNAEFFAELNSQFIDEGRPAAIQGYLGCKNKAGLVAFFYYHSYTISNRFFQLAKYRMKANASIGGTGLAFSMKALQEIGGWQANSLTEDMEMQVMFTERGGRILWNHFAKTYDEKPTRASTVFKQRIRWSQGHWYVSLRGAMPLLRAFLRGKLSLKELISSYCYMFSRPMSVQIPLSVLALLVTAFMQQFQPLRIFGLEDFNTLQSVLFALPFLYSLFGLFFTADYLDNQERPRFSTIFLVIASYVMLYPVCLVSQVIGFFKHRNQHIWVKTDHQINAPRDLGEPARGASKDEPITDERKAI